MLLPVAPWKQDLLAVHLDALELLWNQRLGSWCSPDWTEPALRKLDERIAAHADALVLAGDEALLLLEGVLGREELPALLAAAHVLWSRDDADGLCTAQQTFLAASGTAGRAFGIALRHVSIGRHQEWLLRIAVEGGEPIAVSALSALAFHAVETDYGRLVTLLQSKVPEVRVQAWEAIGYLGNEFLARSLVANLRTELRERFQPGFRDTDPFVRAAAFDAAAWTRQSWLLPLLRERVAVAGIGPEDLPALRLLALLGSPADRPLLQSVAGNEALGPGRMELLSLIGGPTVVEAILAALDADDPELAWAAARSFRHLAGIELPSRYESRTAEDSTVVNLEEVVRMPERSPADKWWGKARGGERLPEPPEEELVLSAKLVKALQSGTIRKSALERLGADPDI